MIIPHPSHPKGGYYMEDKLVENLQALPYRIQKDKDVLGIIVGSPGEGKSTITTQIAYFLDPTITCDTIKYAYEDYLKYSIGLFDKGQSKGKSVIHDEGKEALSAVSVLSKRTKKFMDFLYENRQMNMYQYILTGDFFDIPKSIVMQRALFMIWVHEEGEFENGHFKFFNRTDMRKLYIYGKKERNMESSGYSFRGTFSKFYTVDEDKYRQLKKSHLRVERYIDDKTHKYSKAEVIKQIYIWNPEAEPKLLAEILDYDVDNIYKLRKSVTANCLMNNEGAGEEDYSFFNNE